MKREAEPGVPRGIVSNWLHDHADTGATLKVAPPAGEFYLDEESQRPVVLMCERQDLILPDTIR